MRGVGWIIAALLLAAGLGWTPAAEAGTYDVWSCRGPEWEPVETGAWERSAIDPASGATLLAPASLRFRDTCAQEGGSLSVALAQDQPLHSSIAGLLTFRAPADAQIVGYELSRSLRVGSPPLLALAGYSATRTETAGGAPTTVESCATPACRSIGAPEPFALENVVTGPLEPADEIALRVRVSCPVLELCLDLPPGDAARADLYRSRVTLEDSTPPDDPALSGPLVEGDSGSSGRATLVVASGDRGAGVEAISLEVDGEEWQTVRAGGLASTCRLPYTDPRPCPRTVEQAFEIDTGALAAGDHEASGAVVDAAGNRAEWSPVAFRVEGAPSAEPLRHTPPPSPPVPASPAGNGVPAVERPRLRLAQPTAPRARPGRPVKLRGALETRDGQPIAGARLAVETLQLGVRGGPLAERRAEVVTDAGGRFAVELRARGAQRVLVEFHPRPAARATARAAGMVRTRLALSVSRSERLLVKGRRLTLRGRLRGAGPSARGALVQIQAIVNGRWAPVGTARARADGAYAWRYRFVRLSRDTIFSFRAVVDRVPGWPWPPERSRRVIVLVDIR